MSRGMLVVAGCVLALVLLYMACEQSDIDGARSAEEESGEEGVPAYSDSVPEDGVVAVLTDATTTEDLQAVFEDVRGDRVDGDTWEVRISCASVPELPGVDPLLAVGSFANTLQGLDELDLEDTGDARFERTNRADCNPLPLPAGAVSADDVIAAVEGADLPVSDPYDSSALCSQLGCVRRTTSDQFTVTVWPDEAAAAAWDDDLMADPVRVGPVTTVHLEQAGFDAGGTGSEEEAYETAAATATADLTAD